METQWAKQDEDKRVVQAVTRDVLNCGRMIRTRKKVKQ